MPHTAVRGIRGAITVKKNEAGEIMAATRELLEKLVEVNKFKIEDICCAIFSVTTDLDASFPAAAARELGWVFTPMLCTNEIPVPDSLQRCIRVLLQVNSTRKQEEMIHLYLRDAKTLRPDIGHPTEDQYYKSS